MIIRDSLQEERYCRGVRLRPGFCVMACQLRLLPEPYEVFNPMPYDGAHDMEVELAIGLRWQNALQIPVCDLLARSVAPFDSRKPSLVITSILMLLCLGLQRRVL
jgi:hypothetical protein